MQDDNIYPENEILLASTATTKPDVLVACRRCPNAEWVEEFVESDYGIDCTLRAFCVGLGGRWIWPQVQVSACSARIRAIRAERRQDADPDRDA